MKILKNKILLNLLIIVFMGILGASSYYTYLSYQRYITVENSTKLSDFIERFESVLVKIENERIHSTTYLITQKEDDFKPLRESRVTVDRMLWELDEFIKQYNHFTSYSAQIEEITKELNLVRRKVDDFNADYREIFFHAYHDKVFSPFLEILQEVSITEKSKMMKSYIMMYKKYTELKENSVLENTLISFMLLGSKEMTYKDIELWSQLIRKDTLPQFYTLVP